MPALHAHVAWPWLISGERIQKTERTRDTPLRRLSSIRLTCSGVRSRPRCSRGGGVVKRELDATESMGILLGSWVQDEDEGNRWG